MYIYLTKKVLFYCTCVNDYTAQCKNKICFAPIVIDNTLRYKNGHRHSPMRGCHTNWSNADTAQAECFLPRLPYTLCSEYLCSIYWSTVIYRHRNKAFINIVYLYPVQEVSTWAVPVGSTVNQPVIGGNNAIWTTTQMYVLYTIWTWLAIC